MIYAPRTGRELAEELIGTSGNVLLEDQIAKLSASELAEFEAACFRCVLCDWWCGIHELILGKRCRECAMAR